MDLVNKQTAQLSDFFRYVSAKEQLKQQFEALHLITNQTDASFGCRARNKTTKGLENLEKRLLRAQKEKLADVLERVTDLQNELFKIKLARTTKFPDFI
jgi:phage gp29-like protein